MNDQNLQITEQQSFLFSLIHANTKYDFISLWKITRTQSSQIFHCQIYPLNLNKQIIRINSHSLKIQLNRFLLQSNFNVSSTGFKFKLNPIKGIFYIQYSYLSCLQTNQFLKIEEKINLLKDKIISQLKKSTVIKELLIKILNLNEDGSSLINKQNSMNQLLKYSYNSQFYAWISPNKEKLIQIKKTSDSQEKKSNTNLQLQIWSDCSSDEEDNQDDKQSQTNESFNQKFQTYQNKKLSSFTDFYKHFRTSYDKIQPFDQNQIKSHQNSQGSSISDSGIVVKYFMTQQNDFELYQKHIEKHVEAAYESQENRRKKGKQKQNMMFFPRMYNQLSMSTNQVEWQSNLVSFIESNNLTLSKASKWKIVINIIQKVYRDFINNKVKQKCEYLDMRMYKIQKNLQVSLKSRKDEMGYLIMPQMKKSSDQQFQTKSQSELFQDFFKKQEGQQKNIAAIMLHIACFICVPEVNFINRRFIKVLQTSQTKYQMTNFKYMRKQVSMEGQFNKFKSTNMQVQSILFYFHQKVMKFNQGPFADWVIIMCEKIDEMFQKSPLLF